MLQRLFEYACNAPSDINEHLPVLSGLSASCNHITELGLRSMVSSWAFLHGLPKGGTLVSVDTESPIKYGMDPDVVTKNVANEGKTFKFILGDSLKIDLEPTDFLFIDTDHTKRQLTQELARHASKVKKFIAFHDTDSCPELQPVIHEFLNKNNLWKTLYEYARNNGIIIIEKIHD